MKNNEEQNLIDQKKAIAAIATPVGEGGIAVIRISGKDAFEKLSTIFTGKNLSKADSHTVHFGKIVDKNG